MRRKRRTVQTEKAAARVRAPTSDRCATSHASADDDLPHPSGEAGNFPIRESRFNARAPPLSFLAALNRDSRIGKFPASPLGWGRSSSALAWLVAHRSLVGALTLAGAFSVCTVRLYRLIDRLAVNVIYWDEW